MRLWEEEDTSFSEASICSSGCKKTEKVRSQSQSGRKLKDKERSEVCKGELKLLQSVPWKGHNGCFWAVAKAKFLNLHADKPGYIQPVKIHWTMHIWYIIFYICISYFNWKKYFSQENSNIIVQFTCKQHTQGLIHLQHKLSTKHTQASRKEHEWGFRNPPPW